MTADEQIRNLQARLDEIASRDEKNALKLMDASLRVPRSPKVAPKASATPTPKTPAPKASATSAPTPPETPAPTTKPGQFLSGVQNKTPRDERGKFTQKDTSWNVGRATPYVGAGGLGVGVGVAAANAANKSGQTPSTSGTITVPSVDAMGNPTGQQVEIPVRPAPATQTPISTPTQTTSTTPQTPAPATQPAPGKTEPIRAFQADVRKSEPPEPPRATEPLGSGIKPPAGFTLASDLGKTELPQGNTPAVIGTPLETPKKDFEFTDAQKKWLGGADRTDPYIIARMPDELGPKPELPKYKRPGEPGTKYDPLATPIGSMEESFNRALQEELSRIVELSGVKKKVGSALNKPAKATTIAPAQPSPLNAPISRSSSGQSSMYDRPSFASRGESPDNIDYGADASPRISQAKQGKPAPTASTPSVAKSVSEPSSTTFTGEPSAAPQSNSSGISASDVASGAANAATLATMAPKKTAALAAKLGGAAAGKAAAKLIPGLGLGLGAYDAYQRAKEGDWLGAALSGGAGVASLVPGLGTGIAAGLNTAQLARDAKQIYDLATSDQQPETSESKTDTSRLRELAGIKK